MQVRTTGGTKARPKRLPDRCLRHMRRTAHISAEELAKRLGLSLTTLTNIEKAEIGLAGRRYVAPDLRHRYQRALVEIARERFEAVSTMIEA